MAWSHFHMAGLPCEGIGHPWYTVLGLYTSSSWGMEKLSPPPFACACNMQHGVHIMEGADLQCRDNVWVIWDSIHSWMGVSAWLVQGSRVISALPNLTLKAVMGKSSSGVIWESWSEKAIIVHDNSSDRHSNTKVIWIEEYDRTWVSGLSRSSNDVSTMIITPIREGKLRLKEGKFFSQVTWGMSAQVVSSPQFQLISGPVMLITILSSYFPDHWNSLRLMVMIPHPL